MLTLFYNFGSCSLAPHIVLEESGERYDRVRVNIARNEQRQADYLRINPLGRVPVLKLDDGEALSENTAILPYLGERFGLWPTGALARARALSLIGFFASTVHVAHAHVSRPERYSDDEGAFAGIREKGKASFHGYIKQIDARLAGRDWLGESYSVLDPYAFVFYTWGVRHQLPMTELANFTAFKNRMLERPAVRQALADEEIRI
ncbi:MAG: hypothetical protein BGP06_06935 [Rhizobiales bacterium 65-9]|nr:glutathione S-transferase N-terminal domain-containing protein [Hyphomicrobiales bacterium]OJY35563.1 MAG: hypothetical protein BGP06_06935 [Rhizobiales bacterium 65-9]